MSQLGLVVLEGGVGLEELRVSRILVVLPQPIVLLERVEVLGDRVPDTLDAASEQQRYLDELNVLRDAVEEGVRRPLLLRHGRVSPVDDLLVAGQDGLRRLVDALLDFVERRRQRHVGWDELHVDFEEGLGCVDNVGALPRADALLQGIHRVLRRAQEGLVHEVIVVIAKLGDVLLGDAVVLRLKVIGCIGSGPSRRS